MKAIESQRSNMGSYWYLKKNYIKTNSDNVDWSAFLICMRVRQNITACIATNMLHFQ